MVIEAHNLFVGVIEARNLFVGAIEARHLSVRAGRVLLRGGFVCRESFNLLLEAGQLRPVGSCILRQGKGPVACTQEGGQTRQEDVEESPTQSRVLPSIQRAESVSKNFFWKPASSALPRQTETFQPSER